MSRFWTFLLDARVLGVIGLLALAAFLFLGADTLKLGLIWAALALAALLLVWALVWLVRKARARRAARGLEQAIDSQAAQAANAAPNDRKAEIGLLRERMAEAVKTIHKSKLGERAGSAALYELPWYLVIGNPAAGKSTAIVKSGLNFPFADDMGQIVQGIGGTRNCDWFFTNEGILLDTAGRYSVHEEDQPEWLGFLSLLKRYRPKAPINGIIIAVSAAELAHGRPEQAITLAKNLRQRVQELTENLEVFAPVYIVFTKADLIAGFAEFFEDNERGERDRVWGATLPYERRRAPAGQTAAQVADDKRGADSRGRRDLLGLFDQRFDELTDGLKEMSVARMGMQRGQALPPGVLTFPLEFASLKPALRAFVATLFEDNAFQFQPVFRGFYFTSAVQEGSSSSRASERVAQQFALRSPGEHTTGLVQSQDGFFLKDLFSKVIFADRELVRQHASRRKLRLRGLAFGVAASVLALALGGWTWSWLGNRQLMDSVRADLDKVVRLQAERNDLASRMEAMELLQDRIEQLQRWRTERPLGLTLGLYQGGQIERRLREEYFQGIRLVMLQPVAQTIEAYLTEVNRDPARLKPMARTPDSGAARADGTGAARTGARFIDASPEDSADAYNALKTYLMLAERERLEAGHLNDQITRFWRGWLDDNRGTMPREQLMRSAERLISFATSNLGDPAFPTLSNQLALVDATRQNLREVGRGVRGVDRVYADIKTRAATRFPPVTVAGLITEADKGVLAGSYAVPGPFTREAWDGYVEKAFKDAASSDTQTTDWVLKTAAASDLTLEGSPEQIRKQLTEMYKKEYVEEWRKFMQGVSIADFTSFEQAVERMNRLGDAQNSPIKKLVQLLFDQTSWDNPSLLNERLATTQKGAMEWFKQTILRQAPSRVEVNVNLQAGQATIPLGPIGREFAPLARIVMSRDSTPAPMADYLQALGKVRTRFNQIRTQGDPGPGARLLMGQTLEGGNSELSEALRLVDERMLVGMTPSAREALRPLLVRPLIQAATALVPAAETELNRQWSAQVHEPFQRTLAAKFPFDPASRVEATPAEMAKLLGAGGAIAKFGTEVLGQLVINRGNVIEPRTWGDVGIRLRPEFAAGYPRWVGVAEFGSGAGAAGGGGAATAPGGGAAGAAAPNQTVFEVLPLGAPGMTEYTLVIDGQTLRYRNAAAQWVRMVWPNPGGVAGVRLSGVTLDGQTVSFVNEPGQFGLDRLFAAAKIEKRADGHEMSWTSGTARVALQLRQITAPGSSAQAAAAGSAGSSVAAPSTALGDLRGMKLPATVVGATGAIAPMPANPAPSAAPAAASPKARP
jgi:type VI secretion system protein ImpL